VSDARLRQKSVKLEVHQSLIKSKEKSNEYYDQNAEQSKFKSGDKDLLFDEMVRRGSSRKLSAQWIGQYTITALDTVNVTIARGRKLLKVHINRLKPFHWMG